MATSMTYSYRRRTSTQSNPAASFTSAVGKAKDGAHTSGKAYEVLANGKVIARCTPDKEDRGHLRPAPKCVMVSDHGTKRRGTALNGIRRRHRRK